MKPPLICSVLLTGLVVFGGHSAFAQSGSTRQFTSEDVQKILDDSARVRREAPREAPPPVPLSQNYTLTLSCKDKDGIAKSSQIVATAGFNQTVVLSGAEVGLQGTLTEESAGKIKLQYSLRGLAGWRMNNSGQTGVIYLSPGKAQTIFEEEGCTCALQLTPLPIGSENLAKKAAQSTSQDYTILVACANKGKRQEYAFMVTGKKFGALLRESGKTQNQLNFSGTLEALDANILRLNYSLTYTFGGVSKSYFSSSASGAIAERCEGGVYLNLDQEATVLETSMGTYSFRILKTEPSGKNYRMGVSSSTPGAIAEKREEGASLNLDQETNVLEANQVTYSVQVIKTAENANTLAGEKVEPSGKNYRLKIERTEDGTRSVSSVVVAGGDMDIRSSDANDQSCPVFLSGSLQEYSGGIVGIDYRLRLGMSKNDRSYGSESDSFSSNVYLVPGVPYTILKSPVRSCTLTIVAEE